MEKILVKVLGLSYSQSQTGAYALVLEEANGKRRIPILISGFEAQSIAVELEKISMGRPLTHDLFKSFALGFNIAVKEAIIHTLEEGIFYSKLICSNGEKTIELDSRTSDAVAIALRFGCPVYTYESILSTAGLSNDFEDKSKIDEVEEEEKTFDFIEEEPITKPSKANYPKSFSAMSISELEEQLEKAIDEENYEKASLIRDEIEKRK
jgi:uncharacterized protein